MSDFANGLQSLSGLLVLTPEQSDFLHDAAAEVSRLRAEVEKWQSENARNAAHVVDLEAECDRYHQRLQGIDAPAQGARPGLTFAQDKAIRSLINEISGIWDAFEYGLRTEISNTNYVCVKEKLNAAIDALGVRPIPEGERQKPELLAEAKEALKPFADFADALNEEVPDNIAIGFYADGAMRFGPSGDVTISALRRARAALAALSSTTLCRPISGDGGAQ